jgi:hypothetical protein
MKALWNVASELIVFELRNNPRIDRTKDALSTALLRAERIAPSSRR